MNTRLKKLTDTRGEKLDRLDELIDIEQGTETTDARSLTEDEQKEWDSLDKECQRLNDQITVLERSEKIERKATPVAGEGGEEAEKANIRKRFSLVRAIGAKVEGKPLDGVELEMHQEGVREAKESGMAIRGIGVPMMITNPETRDLTDGTAATAGNLVATDLDPNFILALRPRFVTRELGATFMTGLMGNLDIPRQTTTSSATWAAENATATETTPATEMINLRPNRLAAFTDVSAQLLVQASPDVEAWVRNDIALAIQTAVDSAALNGDGTSNSPTGILNTTGVNNIFASGALSWAEVVALESKIANDNADVNDMAYCSTPGVRGDMKGTLKTSGVSGYIWESDSIAGGMMNGYRAVATTQMPSDLGGDSNDHAMIFGNWRDLIIAQWGGLDILVNPYTKGKEGLVEVIANSFWDVALRRAQSFAQIKDIAVTGELATT